MVITARVGYDPDYNPIRSTGYDTGYDTHRIRTVGDLRTLVGDTGLADDTLVCFGVDTPQTAAVVWELEAHAGRNYYSARQVLEDVAPDMDRAGWPAASCWEPEDGGVVLLMLPQSMAAKLPKDGNESIAERQFLAEERAYEILVSSLGADGYDRAWKPVYSD